MKRLFSILLVLTLTIGLLVPFSAQAADPPCYITANCDSLEPTVLLGKTTSITFNRLASLPASDPQKIILKIEIYKGAVDDVLDQEEPIPVEERQYKCSQFTSSRELTMTWTADKRYAVGDYTLVGYLLSDTNYFYDQLFYIMELHVLKNPASAEELEIAIVDPNNNYEYVSLFPSQIEVNKSYTIGAFLFPVANTNDRKYKITNYDTDGLNVVQTGLHGFVQIQGKKVGTYSFTVDFGSIKRTYYFDVVMNGLRIQLTPENTSLCNGNTDTLKVEYFLSNGSSTSTINPDQIQPIWISSDPSVATVRNGVVTAVAPGTATISIKAGAATQSILYRVHPHNLPATAPFIPNTATKPGYMKGYCSICGDPAARNIFVPAVFIDTSESAWYSPYVDFAYENEIMNGVSSNTFAPNKPMTRAMVATVLYRMAGSPEVEGKIPFTDVPAGKWYADAVLWAANEGVVTGYNNGTFRPDINITREQFATILYRYTKAQGVLMSEGAALSAFPDESSVSAYAREAMRWAVGENLISGVATGGKTYLRPKDNTTRAQFATVITRYMTTQWETAPQ